MNGSTNIAAALAVLVTIGASQPAPPPEPSHEPQPEPAVQTSRSTLKLNPLMVSYEELECLAQNIYFEARGEPESGRVAVAHVTLNRVGAASFPDSICGVVRQGGRQGPCQFEWYCNDRPNVPANELAWLDAQAIAYRVLSGIEPDPTRGALYFHHISLQPGWASARLGATTIGRHIFFRLQGGELGQRQLAQAS